MRLGAKIQTQTSIIIRSVNISIQLRAVQVTL